MDKPNQLMVSLKGRGEKILSQNLSPDEKILVKLQGSSGQALVLTNRCLYIVKWGWLAGSTFGGKCIAYEYRNITAIEMKQYLTSRMITVLTPATQDKKLSRYGGREDGKNATESDNAITYNDKKQDALFQGAVNLGRELISKAHNTTPSHDQDDSLDKLEKLASLKERGLITEQEYTAKKRQLLGL